MRMWGALQKNSLMATLRDLKGNARACVLTEPLWGIPFYLYSPFVSVYMRELGLRDPQIGLVGTVFLLSSVLFSLLSGVLTDKLGRRFCTFWIDLLSWSVPVVLWVFAQSAQWFYVAAFFNGMMRITTNSWNLLLVEDEEEGKLVKLFSLVSIAGSISAGAVLFSYPLVHRFGLVPTVRGMYVFAFASMTAKFIILFFMSHETRIGQRRMAETRERTVRALLRENLGLLPQMLRNRRIMLTVGLLACFQGSKTLTDTFWPLLATDRMGFPEENLALFSAFKFTIMVFGYLLLAPRVSAERSKGPLIFCFSVLTASKVLLIFMPAQAAWLLWVSVALEALALSLLNPLSETLQMLCVDAQDRARLLALFFAMVLLLTSPLSYLAGWLSDLHAVLPFVLTLLLYGGVLLFGRCIGSMDQKGRAADASSAYR